MLVVNFHRFSSCRAKSLYIVLFWLCLVLGSAHASETLRDENVQVMMPVLVGVNERFPVFYRTSPVSGPIALSNRVQVIETDDEKPIETTLEGDEKTAEADKRFLSLHGAGQFKIVFHFSDTTGNTLKKSAVISVVPPEEVAPWSSNKAWEIPENKITLANESGQVTELGFARGVFQRLKSQPNAEDQWVALECWNALAVILKSPWLPTRESVSAFIDISSPASLRVGFGAYRVNDVRIVFRTELGKQTWVYLEADAGLNKFSLTQNRNDFFPAALTGRRNSHIARLFEYKKRLLSDSSSQIVDVLLIHSTDTTSINLRYPRY